MSELKAKTPMSDAEFAAAVDAALATKDAGALASLADCALSKVQRKALKRAAHRLRSAGVSVAIAESAPARKEPAAKSASVDVLATSIDGSGGRMLWLFTDAPDGGREAVAAYVSDTEGYKVIQSAASGRKRANEIRRGLLKSKDVPVVELPGAHARTILDEAEARTRAGGHAFPAGYGALHEIAKKLPEAMCLDPHPAREFAGEVSEREVAEILRGSAPLLDAHPFRGWGPDRETGRVLTAKIEQVMGSTVIVGPAQRIEQLERIFEQAAGEALEGAGRALWVRRLRDAAHVIYLRGDRELGTRAARLAEAISRGSGEGGEQPAFLIALLRRPFEELFAKLREGEPAPAGAAGGPAPKSKLIVPGR